MHAQARVGRTKGVGSLFSRYGAGSEARQVPLGGLRWLAGQGLATRWCKERREGYSTVSRRVSAVALRLVHDDALV